MVAGWVGEVRALLDAGHGDTRAMGSVGYREIRDSLSFPEAGRVPPGDLEAAIVRSTRVFARRQRTWLHHANVTWL
jgi:tRNA dimethylallyltransferase